MKNFRGGAERGDGGGGEKTTSSLWDIYFAINYTGMPAKQRNRKIYIYGINIKYAGKPGMPKN